MAGPLNLGIVGAAGWLGGAIAAAVLEAGVAIPQTLSLSYRSSRPDRFAASFWTSDNQMLADRSDVIILSVRPQDWHDLDIDADGKLVISVMAGIPLEALCRRHRTARVVRSLPNAAAEVGSSYTPWVATTGVGAQDRDITRAIFDCCGVQDEVASEAEIDYLTGLTGSGPAFPALLAEAMMNDAIAHGLDRQVARRAVNTLFVGAGRLLERRDECPAQTVETFLAYRGTTAAGIEAMRNAGFATAVAEGLTAAFRRSVAMGTDS